MKSRKTYNGPKDLSGLMYFVDEEMGRLAAPKKVNDKNICRILNIFYDKSFLSGILTGFCYDQRDQIFY